jgi:hypothetical protein
MPWPRHPLSRRPWFGPKRLVGWGWSPSSWQGWFVTGLFVAAVALAAAAYPHHRWAIVLLVVVYLLVVVLTGDPPGSPGSSRRPRDGL